MCYFFLFLPFGFTSIGLAWSSSLMCLKSALRVGNSSLQTKHWRIIGVSEIWKDQSMNVCDQRIPTSSAVDFFFFSVVDAGSVDTASSCALSSGWTSSASSSVERISRLFRRCFFFFFFDLLKPKIEGNFVFTHYNFDKPGLIIDW